MLGLRLYRELSAISLIGKALQSFNELLPGEMANSFLKLKI